MKSVIQRVKEAEVVSENKILGKINEGMVVLLGVGKKDNKKKAEELAQKISDLRIFPSPNKNIDRSVQDIKGEILVVSQFTLCADASKGNRPSFMGAASPEKAEELYNYFIESLRKSSDLKVEAGKFGAMMDVKLTNEGPVTIILNN